MSQNVICRDKSFTWNILENCYYIWHMVWIVNEHCKSRHEYITNHCVLHKFLYRLLPFTQTHSKTGYLKLSHIHMRAMVKCGKWNKSPYGNILLMHFRCHNHFIWCWKCQKVVQHAEIGSVFRDDRHAARRYVLVNRTVILQLML